MIRHDDHGHRTYRALAKCQWKRAAWVEGEGPFALTSLCHRDGAVTLHETGESANECKREIDQTGCGGGCYGHHYIYDLRATR